MVFSTSKNCASKNCHWLIAFWHDITLQNKILLEIEETTKISYECAIFKTRLSQAKYIITVYLIIPCGSIVWAIKDLIIT